MKYNILLFKVSIITAGIIMVSSVVFMYFPYLGMWDESKILEGLGDSEIMLKAKSLEEVRLFLEKYPDADIHIEKVHSQIVYVAERTIKTSYGDELRKLDMQIQFDIFVNPSPYVIGCSGEDVSVGGASVILKRLQSDWCFDGNPISLEE